LARMHGCTARWLGALLQAAGVAGLPALRAVAAGWQLLAAPSPLRLVLKVNQLLGVGNLQAGRQAGR